jgi:hypothetical protein
MLFSIPDDLPPDGVEAQTGMACPDCSGTLVVLVPKNFATFRCRVGHAYSLLEVVMGKEDMVERRLWETVASLEELADFLELASRHRFNDLDPGVCQRRSAVPGTTRKRCELSSTRNAHSRRPAAMTTLPMRSGRPHDQPARDRA